MISSFGTKCLAWVSDLFSDILKVLVFSATVVVGCGGGGWGCWCHSPEIHSWKRHYALCILILLAHNICSMEHVWRIHQSVYITQTLGHMKIHYISFITSTLHILHGGCLTRASRIHCIYFISRAYVAFTHWCTHHTYITVYVDTLHIQHGVYTAYAPWRTCHAYMELHMQCNIAILAVYYNIIGLYVQHMTNSFKTPIQFCTWFNHRCPWPGCPVMFTNRLEEESNLWWSKTKSAGIHVVLGKRLFLGFNWEYASHYLLSTMPWGKHMVLYQQ